MRSLLVVLAAAVAALAAVAAPAGAAVDDTVLVSRVGLTGAPADNTSSLNLDVQTATPSISGDGSRVAFITLASNLGSGPGLYVKEMTSGALTFIASLATPQGSGSSQNAMFLQQPRLADSGQFVCYIDFVGTTPHVLVRNLSTAATVDGGPAFLGSLDFHDNDSQRKFCDVSDDGNKIAYATDVSHDALAVAAENAKRHNVADRLDLLQGDLAHALDQHPVARSDASLHYLVSNPPYIPDHEWDAVEPNVKNHEPHLALRGGKDGMDFTRRLLADAPRHLRPGGDGRVAARAWGLLVRALEHPARPRVVEAAGVELHHVERGALVVGVAGAALLGERSMEAALLLDGVAQRSVLVTVQAEEVGHAFPELVTLGAVVVVVDVDPAAGFDYIAAHPAKRQRLLDGVPVNQFAVGPRARRAARRQVVDRLQQGCLALGIVAYQEDHARRQA